jgi:3-methylcrotonyl-CoA carboxylase alpha subunit/geranyl-CoA carboxylase alpha subunit
LRFDHALFAGLEVPPSTTSMLGKLISHAPTRAEAIGPTGRGTGPHRAPPGLPSNRAFLAACLRHPQFRAGQALIPFLAEAGGRDPGAVLQQEERAVAADAGVAALLPHGASAALPRAASVRPVRLRHRGRADRSESSRIATGVAPAAAMSVRLPDGRWHIQQGSIDLFIATPPSIRPAAPVVPVAQTNCARRSTAR